MNNLVSVANCTGAVFDSLPEKDDNFIYFVSDRKEIYKGSELFSKAPIYYYTDINLALTDLSQNSFTNSVGNSTDTVCYVALTGIPVIVLTSDIQVSSKISFDVECFVNLNSRTITLSTNTSISSSKPVRIYNGSIVSDGGAFASNDNLYLTRVNLSGTSSFLTTSKPLYADLCNFDFTGSDGLSLVVITASDKVYIKDSVFSVTNTVKGSYTAKAIVATSNVNLTNVNITATCSYYRTTAGQFGVLQVSPSTDETSVSVLTNVNIKLIRPLGLDSASTARFCGINIAAGATVDAYGLNVDGSGDTSCVGFGVLVKNNGQFNFHGGEIKMAINNRVDSSTVGIISEGSLYIDESFCPVVVSGCNYGLGAQLGSSSKIYGGLFEGVQHGGSYISSGSTGFFEAHGSTFRNSVEDYETVPSEHYASSYFGAPGDTGTYAINLYDCKFIAVYTKTSIPNGIVLTNNSSNPPTLNLFNCSIRASITAIRIDEGGTVNIYDGTVIDSHTTLYDNPSRVNDYRVNKITAGTGIDISPNAQNRNLVISATGGGGSSTVDTGLLAYDSLDKFISDFNSGSYVSSSDIGSSTTCVYNKYTNTLQLWKDVSLTQTITITKPLKFDLNGYSLELVKTTISYSGTGQLYIYSSSLRSKISSSSMTTSYIYTLSDGSLKTENVDYNSSFAILDITKSFDSSHSIEFSNSNITISEDRFGIYSQTGIHDQTSDSNSYCTAEFRFYFCNITFGALINGYCGLRTSGSLTLSNCTFKYHGTNNSPGKYFSCAIFQECVGVPSFLKITDCEFNGDSISDGANAKAVISYSQLVEISGLQYSGYDSNFDGGYSTFHFDIQGTRPSSVSSNSLVTLDNCHIHEGSLYVGNSKLETVNYELEIRDSSIINTKRGQVLKVLSSSSHDTVRLYNTRINLTNCELLFLIEEYLSVFSVKTKLDVAIVGGEYTSYTTTGVASVLASVFLVKTTNSSSSPSVNIDVNGSRITGQKHIVESESVTDPSNITVNFFTSDVKVIKGSEFVSQGINAHFVSDYQQETLGYPNATSDLLNSVVISNILNSVFPVNTIIPFYDNDNHSSYLGFTWERCLAGRVPVGIDSTDSDFNTIGKKLGEKTHVLTPDESCPLSSETRPLGAITSTKIAGPDYAGNATAGHNNIQPSEVVAFWKRVS